MVADTMPRSTDVAPVSRTHLLFFTVVSLPLHRYMNDLSLQDDYRVGGGAIFLFGGAP